MAITNFDISEYQAELDNLDSVRYLLWWCNCNSYKWLFGCSFMH